MPEAKLGERWQSNPGPMPELEKIKFFKEKMIKIHGKNAVLCMNCFRIGLDLLTHWQAVVDVPRRIMRINFCAKEVPFLSEMEIVDEKLRRLGHM